jgi:hypothetical protein
MSDSLIDVLRKEAIPPEKFIRNKLYRSLRDSRRSLVAVKYLDYVPGWRMPPALLESPDDGNTKYYVFENLITNGLEYYKLERPPALLTLLGSYGPKFILPYEETLRETALRQLPQFKYADEYTGGIINDVIHGVREEKEGKWGSIIYLDPYIKKIREDMEKEKKGKSGGRRKSKRRVRSKKYRTRRR